MAYSTVDEVKEICKGLIESAGEYDITAKFLSDDQIEYEISNADMQIDLALRRKYNLPLPLPVPIVCNKLSCDIAAALCDLNFRGSKEYASDLNPFRLRYDRAVLILAGIAEGLFPIYNEGEEPGDGSGVRSIVINPYPGDVLFDTDVFPRGVKFRRSRTGGGLMPAEYSEVEQYNPGGH